MVTVGVGCWMLGVEKLRRILIEIVVVGLPLVIAHDEVEIMAVGERMAVVELAVVHIHIATRTGLARHNLRRSQRGEVEIVESRGVQPFRTVERAVVIGREAGIAVFAEHHHPRQRKIVFFRGVKRHSGTTEQAVASVGIFALVPLILIGF